MRTKPGFRCIVAGALLAVAGASEAQSAYSGFGPNGSFAQAAYRVSERLLFRFTAYDSGPLTSFDVVVSDWANYPFGASTSGPLDFAINLYDDPDAAYQPGSLLGSWTGTTNGQQFGSVGNQVSTSLNVPASGVSIASGRSYYFQVTSQENLALLVGDPDLLTAINTGSGQFVYNSSPAFEVNVNGFRGPVGHAVPEPSSVALLSLTCWMTIYRQRKRRRE